MDHIWLSILVTTRCIVIVPNANILGYNRKSRMEEAIDTNQYFPYGFMHQTLCMRTIVGQTINDICRYHLFHLSFTFHGVMDAIV